MLPYTDLWDGSSEAIACRVHILPIGKKKKKERRKKKERKVGGREKETERKKIHWKWVMRLLYNVAFSVTDTRLRSVSSEYF